MQDFFCKVEPANAPPPCVVVLFLTPPRWDFHPLPHIRALFTMLKSTMSRSPIFWKLDWIEASFRRQLPAPQRKHVSMHVAAVVTDTCSDWRSEGSSVTEKLHAGNMCSPCTPFFFGIFLDFFRLDW